MFIDLVSLAGGRRKEKAACGGSQAAFSRFCLPERAARIETMRQRQKFGQMTIPFRHLYSLAKLVYIFCRQQVKRGISEKKGGHWFEMDEMGHDRLDY